MVQEDHFDGSKHVTVGDVGTFVLILDQISKLPQHHSALTHLENCNYVIMYIEQTQMFLFDTDFLDG